MNLYVEGPMGSGKTRRLVSEAVALLDCVPTASVLILCSNHDRQKRFSEQVLARLHRPMSQLPIYTYAGYVRNTLFNFWPLVEAEVLKTLPTTRSVIMPQLSGMEDSEFILRKILQRFRQKAPMAFEEFPGTEAGLIKQLVRRIRLRSENRLSREEMGRRSELLEEMCLLETAEVEKIFDRTCYALRVLDPNKQLDVFHRLIATQPSLQAECRDNLRYLIVDDVDETIPAQQQFIEFVAPSLEQLILAADIDGGSRRGYLNAYPYDWQKLKGLREGETVVLDREDPIYHDAQRLLENWKREDGFEPLSAALYMAEPTLTQVEMLDRMLEDLLQALQSGRRPGEFAIILPEASPLMFYQIRNRLSRRGVRVQLLSGTRRPLDNPLCRGLIYLLQLANSQAWNYRLSPIEFKTILTHLLQLNRWDLPLVEELVRLFVFSQAAGEVEGAGIPRLEQLPAPLPAEAASRYEALEDWLSKASRMTFEQQIHSAFLSIVTPFAATEADRFQDLSRWIQSYGRQKAIHDAMDQATVFGMSLGEGETADTTVCFERLWLSQVKTGSVADTPDTPEAIDPDAVVVGSPQKIIDVELRRKVQFWLDIGSRQWARSDNAPLYNAWVHSAVWDGSTAAFSEDFKEAIIRTRAAHITRTLMLLAQERVQVYESELDAEGFSQVGLLRPRLVGQPTQALGERTDRPTLRPDQQPIMEYQAGQMAITAVPGAGKTFINVELILTLIERGVPPEQILVLTYMDSAAKTVLSRLKSKLPAGCRSLPVVSTIHSLAFRILTENDHALSLGFLPDDVEILDDQQKDEVIQRVAALTQPESVNSTAQWVGVVDRAVSHAKMHGLSSDRLESAMGRLSKSFRLKEFIPAYCYYQQTLRQRGQLDFNDLILKAVELLETIPEVRQKYQGQFTYIIEDEAQDSSRMLQRLIHLIGGERPNLIRTGDPNQSITTTFSSADPSVFRDFIQGADRVVQMSQSGRCAPEVITLANQWITAAEGHALFQGAFQPVAMEPVPGLNPSLLYPLAAHRFETARQETLWMVETLRHIRQAYPEASVAILLKENRDVLQMTGELQAHDIPAVSLSESLNMHPVFATLLATLKVLESPGEVEAYGVLLVKMAEAGLVDATPERLAFLAETPLLYRNVGAVEDERLLQLYYDLLDFSRDAAGSNVCNLLIRMTDRFFLAVGDRSNGYLCALWAQEILNQHKDTDDLSPLEIVTRQFEVFQRSKRRKKGFSELMCDAPSAFVQVMTLHKSKGQEFDVVFMPHMTETYFPSRLEDIRFKEPEKVIQELDRVLHNGHLSEAYPAEVRRAILQEQARLLYVGLSRARRALFLSAHTEALVFGKIRPVAPAWAFGVLAELIAKGAEATEEVPIA